MTFVLQVKNYISLSSVEPPVLDNNQPKSMKVIINEKISLAVQAEGFDLSFQWFKNGTPLEDGKNHYRGVITPTLYISRASIQHSGEYNCAVSNEKGRVSSLPQALFVGEC